MASGRIRNFGFGVEGVNLVIDPLKMRDGEAIQLQNGELVPNANVGGLGALTQRKGLVALNSSAMGGGTSVLGIVDWPLKTTFTRTLYAARGTEDSNTFKTSTDGSTWGDVSTPLAAAQDALFGDNTNVQVARRGVSLKGLIVYPGNGYTQDTDNPTVVSFDGTDAFTVTSIPESPSGTAGSPPFVILDALTVGDKIYLATSDPGGGSPDFAGRVLELNITTGKMRQIANAFGNGTGEVDGGAPACLAFYQNQLWAGLNGSATTDGIGTIVRCHPDVDTAWVTDVSDLRSHITSLVAFSIDGNLHCSTRASVSTGSAIYSRSNSAQTWTERDTGAGGAGANGHHASLIEYESALYAVEYHETAPIIHIVTSTNGTSWATSRDVDSVDSGAAGNLPGNAIVFGGKLYMVFRSTTAGGTDGFIMENASGSWSLVDTDNYAGLLAVLTERS